MTDWHLGKRVAEASGDAVSVCLCTLDEVVGGHRHHCIEHRICLDCLEDWKENE